MSTTSDLLIAKAKASNGWVYIEVYGESWVYRNGVFHHEAKSTLSASLYRPTIKRIYLHW
jgi:hypothetical protein